MKLVKDLELRSASKAQNLLTEQRDAMASYKRILKQRLDNTKEIK